MITQTTTGAGRLGASNYAGPPAAGNTTLVAAGANVRGIAIRTIVLWGNASGTVALIAGGIHLAIALPDVVISHLSPGFIVPPGMALVVQASALGTQAVISWDLL